MAKLALFLDGTTDTEAGNTNVWRLNSLCVNDGVDQKVFYSAGVGTELGEKIRGGLFGYGIDDVVIAAYEWLIETYADGDEVFIFGFSRGAFTARSLAGLISRCGLISLGAPLSVKQLYDRYRQGDKVKSIHELLEVKDRSGFNNEERWVVTNCYLIDVKFVGVWDTVAALANGVPLTAVTGGDHSFLDANLRKTERYAYHALAIDENRQLFDATLFTVYADKNTPFVQPRSIADVEQRWFCGSHGDVGGGGYNDLAAQIPLKWLMSKAKLHGLAFRQDIVVDPEAYDAALDDSFRDKDFTDILQEVVLQHGMRHWRPIARAPEPRTITIIHTINESIDKSVFDRCRTNPTYRPQNLVNWEAEKGKSLTEIETSVSADTPSVAVPD
ncbi:DUF2235 domain-containing protein [Methylovirgula sp. HY1]|uniref:phospholipase effector Tle1 domain-containing protein n=1 Tax=Methylovirgula sp. HY1 TaxID=2822761 RepID=UPI001C5AA06D|nr:DUF2235 domain-containing protein [Methylovirgula sp. HY1]QXX76133.1 hypothetical protein MHY1_02968 [Methylovirgula sp. HY1]